MAKNTVTHSTFTPGETNARAVRHPPAAGGANTAGTADTTTAGATADSTTGQTAQPSADAAKAGTKARAKAPAKTKTAAKK